MRYQIRVRGHLDRAWSAWFDGLAISHEAGGDTLLEGELADQAALHGVLARVRDLGLPLLAVTAAAVPVATGAAGRGVVTGRSRPGDHRDGPNDV